MASASGGSVRPGSLAELTETTPKPSATDTPAPVAPPTRPPTLALKTCEVCCAKDERGNCLVACNMNGPDAPVATPRGDISGRRLRGRVCAVSGRRNCASSVLFWHRQARVGREGRRSRLRDPSWRGYRHLLGEGRSDGERHPAPADVDRGRRCASAGKSVRTEREISLTGSRIGLWFRPPWFPPRNRVHESALARRARTARRLAVSTARTVHRPCRCIPRATRPRLPIRRSPSQSKK